MLFPIDISPSHPKEIEDAGWYSPDALPSEMPSEATIARKLINHYLEENGPS